MATNNYIRVTDERLRRPEHHVFHFDDRDQDSVECAASLAAQRIVELGGSVTDVIAGADYPVSATLLRRCQLRYARVVGQPR